MAEPMSRSSGVSRAPEAAGPGAATGARPSEGAAARREARGGGGERKDEEDEVVGERRRRRRSLAGLRRRRRLRSRLRSALRPRGPAVARERPARPASSVCRRFAAAARSGSKGLATTPGESSARSGADPRPTADPKTGAGPDSVGDKKGGDPGPAGGRAAGVLNRSRTSPEPNGTPAMRLSSPCAWRSVAPESADDGTGIMVVGAVTGADMA